MELFAGRRNWNFVAGGGGGLRIINGIVKLQGTQVLEKGFTPGGSGPAL